MLPAEADPAAITVMRDEVARQTSALARDCYTSVTRKDANLAGQVDIAFTVDPSGTVRHVSVASNNTAQPELACCLALTFPGIKLPPPAKTTRYKAPFHFQRTGAPDGNAK